MKDECARVRIRYLASRGPYGKRGRSDCGAVPSLLIGPIIPEGRRALRFVIAVLLVLGIGGVRLALIPIMGTQAPLLPFLLAVLAAASLGGRGPGLLASILSPLFITLFFSDGPHGTHILAWSAHVVFFAMISVLVVLLMHQLQLEYRAQHRALLAAREAERAARQAERHASASAAQLHLIADSMPALIAYVDAKQHYRFSNRLYEEWIGVPPEKVIGRHVRDVLGEAAYAAVRVRMEEALSGRCVHFEAQMPFRENGMRHIEAHYIPDVGPQNAVMGYCVLVIDVTERKRAEEALVEANRRKDEFLAMLAHELRNPLAPIRNVAYVLANCPVDAATLRRNSGILERQANQLTRLVDDLLDVARITRGAIELRREPLAIEKILQTALETVQPLFAVKRQTVNSTPTAQHLRVEADAVRLSQVFANLLANAAKFSPDRALIEVCVDEADGNAVVRIRDSGIGIDKQMLPRIFDLFMQADRSLDRSQGGLGVGLTIVKSLVQMHGGEVEAHSAGVGRGSEFIVRLPLLPVGDRAATFLSPGGRAKAIRRRVLVVDDSLDAADSLAALLGTAGHVVQTAHDAASALLVLHSFPAEVIFLDIGLPGTDGYVLAQSIRERFPRVSHRLYALTGYGREEDRTLALSSGFDEHLTKPVDPEHLLGLIANECPSEMPPGNPPR
jgi:PAS domain S-box-containing protein